jgi:hypothetical protein
VARAFWRLFFPMLYAFLRVTDPFWLRVTERRGLVNTVELFVVGRRSGRERRVMLGLLAVGDRRYLGMPTPKRPGSTTLRRPGKGAGGRRPGSHGRPRDPHPARRRAGCCGRGGLAPHPFPVDIAYRLARASIGHDGVFFRIEALDGAPIPLPARARRV